MNRILYVLVIVIVKKKTHTTLWHTTLWTSTSYRNHCVSICFIFWIYCFVWFFKLTHLLHNVLISSLNQKCHLLKIISCNPYAPKDAKTRPEKSQTGGPSVSTINSLPLDFHTVWPKCFRKSIKNAFKWDQNHIFVGPNILIFKDRKKFSNLLRNFKFLKKKQRCQSDNMLTQNLIQQRSRY